MTFPASSRTAKLRSHIQRIEPSGRTTRYSISTILGILPIALALGASSGGRRSLGVAVVGGLVVSSALTLYVVPAVYS